MKKENEGKKFKVKRELKFRVPADTLKAISKACEGYGNGQVVAEAAGIPYQVLALVIKTKMSTHSTIEKILKGIELTKSVAA